MKTKFFFYCLLTALLGNFADAQSGRHLEKFNANNYSSDYEYTAQANFTHRSSGGVDNSGCVEIKIVKGTHRGGAMKYLYKKNWGFEPEEVYAEFDVRYDQSMGEGGAGFGGKSPGFSGTYEEAGWGNRPGYGLEGWSARGTINCDNQNYVQNRYYLYHTYTNYDAPVRTGSTDYRKYNPKAYTVNNPGNQPFARKETFGSSLNWGDWSKRDAGDMDFDKWYHVKQYVKMNDIGQNNGILRAWVNGVQVCNFTNINFRRVNTLKVYAYWISYYNGGQDVADGDAKVWIDNFETYTQDGGSSTVDASSIRVTPSDESLKVGETKTIIATVLPDNTTDKSVTWTSNNNSVANVNSNGVVTAIGVGTAKIEATTSNGKKAESTIMVSDSDGGASSGETIVHMAKRNSSAFSLNGGDRMLKLWSTNKNGLNQQWEEISRGNGFYSYKSIGANKCIDGGAGGKNGQNIKMVECEANNRNQHWKKVAAGNQYFSLLKRNSSNYAIDGGNGGAKNQNAVLRRYNNSNRNQQWGFSTLNISLSKSSSSKNFVETLVEVYPNPFTSKVVMSLQGNHTYNTVNLYTITGSKVIYSQDLDSSKNEYVLSLENLNLQKGIYFLSLTGPQVKSKTIKLIKK